MAPEQGPVSSGDCAKTTESTNTVGTGSPNTQPTIDTKISETTTTTLNVDSLSWIYLLKKERLIEECKRYRIYTEGHTVAELRSTLSAYVRDQRKRKSTENILREVEMEIAAEEARPVTSTQNTTPAVTIKTISPQREQSGISNTEVMNTVRRWDVHYAGGDTLYDFLERIEELAECYLIKPDQLLPTLPEILRGKALQWFRLRKQQLHTWADFRSEAGKFFLPKRHISQLEDAIRQRKQTSRENAKDYILALQTMIRRHPTLCKEDHLERIYDGLRVEYRLFVKRGEFQTIEQLMELTDEYELLRSEEAKQSRLLAHSLCTVIIEELEEQNDQITNFLSTLTDRYDARNTCWRCKKRGHRRSHCNNKRRLFCSRCGRDGTLSRDCACYGMNRNNPKTPALLSSVAKGMGNDGRFYIQVSIEGLMCRALIDTGATVTYINEAVRRHLERRKIPPLSNRHNVQLADQSCIVSTHSYPVKVEYNDQTASTLVSVIPNLAESVILGMDCLAKRNVTVSLDGKPLATAGATKANASVTLHYIREAEHLNEERKIEHLELIETHQKAPTHLKGPNTAAEHRHNTTLKESYYPDILLRNNGEKLVTNAPATILKDHNITHRFTKPCAPHKNPTERVNRVIKTRMAQCTKQDQRNWQRELPEKAFAINTTQHKSTAEINFNRNFVGPREARTKYAMPEDPPPFDAVPWPANKPRILDAKIFWNPPLIAGHLNAIVCDKPTAGDTIPYAPNREPHDTINGNHG
ncbi:uncharacterized protein [Eurosta solidaginis]|uniref:uncharacterized protein n=1 Tax=Eurosta solidaginis TaxID=178769 RepID=UPI0035305F2E